MIMFIGYEDHVIGQFSEAQSQVYKYIPQSIPKLKEEIIRKISEIKLKLC